MTYQSATEVWKALSDLPPGEERAAILKKRRNRNLILNSGSFVVISTGEPKLEFDSYREKLSPIRVLQTQRLNVRDGSFDGKGTFGGLSERTRPGENLLANLHIAASEIEGKTVDEISLSTFRNQFERLVALRDDLKLAADGSIQTISDIAEIARTTAARETMEEALEIIALGDITKKLNIDDEGLRFIFQEAALVPVPLTQVKDDNFVINIWSGDLDNPAYAVTPFGHLMTLTEDSFDTLIAPGKEKMQEGLDLLASDTTGEVLKGREILGIEDVPLFDALKQWGKTSPNGGPCLSQNYRYPHEWISVWRKAQVALGLHHGSTGGGMGTRRLGMIALMKEVQHAIIDECMFTGETPYNVDLIGALKQMNGGSLKDASQLEGFEEDFGLEHGTFLAMHQAAEDVMRERGHVVSNPVHFDAAKQDKTFSANP